MKDNQDRKDYRRKKLSSKYQKRKIVSEEDRHIHKANKQKRQQIQHLREEEYWEDWESYN
jgi:hypothetical protein